MTAEERALAVVGDLDQDWLDDPVAKVAAAIRAAEDEALERAAQTLDKANAVCGDTDGICRFCAQRRRDAKVIRALKSGGAA